MNFSTVRSGSYRPAGFWSCTVGLASSLLGIAATLVCISAHAQTPLANQPMFSQANVPNNLVLALSVEFPTAVTAADRSTSYTSSSTYLGYFDPLKCYTYNVAAAPIGSYFAPIGPATTGHGCTGAWSGNFMNWATMQAVDPFRWALTGGYRAVDTTAITILEKAVAPSNQGNASNNFPFKSLATAEIGSATPFTSGTFNMQVLRCGTSMVFRRDSTGFTSGSGCPASIAWDGNVATATTVVTYSIQVRVQVCANAALKEANCVAYGGGSFKPEGLIQQYASKIRYSAFGYLNDPTPTGGSKLRDGGVMRARMKFVGPTQPVPGSLPIPNVASPSTGQITTAEWSATTGIFEPNPDQADAAASSELGSVITTSGVINYLNQFGRSSSAYKYYDPVGELYYSATRYLRGKENVPAYSDLSTFDNGPSNLVTRMLMKDGFPVITNWTVDPTKSTPNDPILYSCQRNIVLGIGDTNTNQDKSVPGNTSFRSNEPAALPAEVVADAIDVIGATNKVGVLEGDMGSTIGQTDSYNTSNNSAYIAGMAYMFHTTDIRPDLPGTQTISTFWLDVLEGGGYKGGSSGRNQFYLAAKYGGFQVPAGYSFATATTPLPAAWWSTTGDKVPIPSADQPRPDNFYLANQADKMVSGLTAAFLDASKPPAPPFTTSFAAPLPQVAQTNNASFSAQYDANTWTGDVVASVLDFDTTTGVPTLKTPASWTFSAKLATQLAGTGWSTNRRVVTWNGVAGIPFGSAAGQVSGADLTALDSTYVPGNDSVNLLNYLRGDRTNEAGVAGGTGAYRARTKLIGDIVGSKAAPVGAPSFPFSDATNPGYLAFKTLWATRRTVVYVAANDGMVHAINGALLTSVPGTPSLPALEVDANAGQEMFAFVPRALFLGPNGTPSTDGLASLGNSSFVHHYLANATPLVYDLDFKNTPGSTATAPDWHSVLIGGLGKGGKAFYAIDVTDPVGMSVSESAAANKVLWEFNNSSTGPSVSMAGELGYSFGTPLVMKTAKYGWVAVFTSGYNNIDGKGYFFFVNPKTGALLEKVSTGAGSVGSDAGLAQANAFIVEASDGTADAIYAGDLLGNLWRLDVRAASGNYATPTKVAVFRDAANNAQPVTSSPAIEVDPRTKKRVVMVGTGRLLDTTDISSTLTQSFYAIFDGTNAGFLVSPTTPAPAFPYSRANLSDNTGLATTTGVASAATSAGWFEDLGVDVSRPASAGPPLVAAHTGTGIAYRVISDATTLSGSVAFAAIVPSGDPCNPSGASRVYGRRYSDGLTTVLNASLALTSFVPYDTSLVTDLRFLSVNGKGSLISGTDSGSVEKVNISPADLFQIRRLNWRELEVAN